MELADKIRELATPLLADESQFVVSVSVSSLQGPQKVTVALDGDNGITIDDCAELSKKLSDALEEQGLIGENFTLEVSTPGVDKPLKLKRQYVKNTGRNVKVVLIDKKVEEGTLTAVTDETITLTQESGEGKKKESRLLTLAFGEIDKAFVQVSFK